MNVRVFMCLNEAALCPACVPASAEDYGDRLQSPLVPACAVGRPRKWTDGRNKSSLLHISCAVALGLIRKRCTCSGAAIFK